MESKKIIDVFYERRNCKIDKLYKRNPRFLKGVPLTLMIEKAN